MTVSTLEPIVEYQWKIAVEVLTELLKKFEGTVSTRAVRGALESRGIPEARELVARLKSVDFDARDAPSVAMRWYHFGRSFLTEENYRQAQKSQEVEAGKAEEEGEAERVTDEEPGEEVSIPEKRKRRAEERRLTTYIVPILVELYDADLSPETYVFDVQSEKSGGDFENVDLLAVHWRSAQIVDLVTVEVKLRFTSLLVQQACNYCRFSDRVWIALPVKATIAKDAAAELRAAEPLLFDHVVNVGLGILACHKGAGKAYDVFPIHWPRRNVVDPLERERFLERYRTHFEKGGVVPAESKRFPRVE
jgi:hypothetical protein